jgi:P27 family predicted phage terminase small subunit
MKGRKPVPSAIKKLRGNPGKRALNTREPAPVAGRPTKPTGLTATASGLWDHFSELFAGMGVLTVADGPGLALLVDAFEEWHGHRETVAEEGPFYECKTEGGGLMVRAHPAVAARADAWKRAKAMLVEFGGTPSARARIHTEGQDEESSAEKFLFPGR